MAMSIFLCNSSLPLSWIKATLFTTATKKTSTPISIWSQKALIHAFTGALSFGLALSLPPASIALEPSSPSLQTSPSSGEFCREEEREERFETAAPELVTNEGIVQEAWEIVNDSFLDATDRHRWSPQTWLQKKEDLIGTSIQTRTKAHDIIKRMLASLGDPYTRFVPPPEFSKMARYDMTGIGINLREVPDDVGGVKLKVLGLILDGPAHTAGVRQGDELLSVNGVDVRGRTAFEASSLLQGPSETLVNIMVRHGNCGPVQSIDVQRQLVARTPVFYKLEQIDNAATSVGYVRLKEFNALARKDIVTAMQRLQDMGASFFILDLRDNLGGLVQAGIEIAKLFLNEGETVIYTAGREPQYQKNIIADSTPLFTAPVIAGIEIAKLFLNEGETVIYTAGREPQYQKNIIADSTPLFTAPVIVLVNKNTASASEIVASALHDNCRAVLVGERTFGKGLIQSVFELGDGSGVVVTIGKYVTPNHMDINGNGIEPDFNKFPDWNEVTEHLTKCHKLYKEG